MSVSTHQVIEKDLKLPVAKSISTILPQWLIRLCRPSRMLWFAPLLGFMLTIPSFFSGYTADDHLLKQNSITKTVYSQRPDWDYFNFVPTNDEAARLRERGVYAWWTPDSYRINFLRPLSSLVHAWQFRLFADAPWVMHIGLGLLYALTIVLCTRLLIGFSSTPVAAGIAMLLFAINDTHAYSVGWISAYNTVLCCMFGLIALLMHCHWRRRKSTLGLFLSVFAFLLSLLSSEGGLALMGYIVAYALFIEPGSWRKKTASIIPTTIIAIGYVLFYVIQDFGVKGSSAYLSPADDLWGTACAVLSNTAIMVVSEILSIPPVTVMFQFIGAAGVVIAVVLLVIILFTLRSFLRSNRIVAFFGTGMVLSIIPFTLGGAQDRLLLWAGLGAAGLLGELFTSSAVTVVKLQRVSAKTLLFTNTVMSLIFFIPILYVYTVFEVNAKALEKNSTSQNTIVLNTYGSFSFLYAPAIRSEKGGEWPEHFYYLYDGADTLTIKRASERTLLATTSKGWLATSAEQLSRSKYYPFSQGDTVKMKLMTAVIEDVSSGGRPISVRFTFKDDMRAFAWMKWTKNGPQRCELPAIGGEMRLVAPMF